MLQNSNTNINNNKLNHAMKNYTCLLSALLNLQDEKPKSNVKSAQALKQPANPKRTVVLTRQKAAKLVGACGNGAVKKQASLGAQTKPVRTITGLTTTPATNNNRSRSILKTRALSNEQLANLIAQSPNPGQRLCEMIKRSKSAESESPTRRARRTSNRRRSLSSCNHSTVGASTCSSRRHAARFVEKSSEYDGEFELIDKFFAKGLAPDKRRQIFLQLVELVACRAANGFAEPAATNGSENLLENELRLVSERNRALEIELEEKTREVQKYTNLLNELKENISVIIKELGEQETASRFKLLSIHNSLSSSNDMAKKHHHHARVAPLAVAIDSSAQAPNLLPPAQFAPSAGLTPTRQVPPPPPPPPHPAPQFHSNLNHSPNYPAKYYHQPPPPPISHQPPVPYYDNNHQYNNHNYHHQQQPLNNNNNNNNQNHLQMITSKTRNTNGNGRKHNNNNNRKTESTTSSDTLIDADSSFADSIAKLEHKYRSHHQQPAATSTTFVKPVPIYPQMFHHHNHHQPTQPQASQPPNIPYHYQTGFINHSLQPQQIAQHNPAIVVGAGGLSPNHNQVKEQNNAKSRKNRYPSQDQDDDDDEDDEDDEERMVINIDELNLTSLISVEHHDTTDEDSLQVFTNLVPQQQQQLMQTIEHQNQQPLQQAQPHLNGSFGSAAGNQVALHYIHHYHHHQGEAPMSPRQAEDEEFERGLKTLDEKILKVKQMLESMKHPALERKIATDAPAVATTAPITST